MRKIKRTCPNNNKRYLFLFERISMLKIIFKIFWKKYLDGYKLIRVKGWNCALIEKQGQRQTVWFNRPVKRVEVEKRRQV